MKNKIKFLNAPEWWTHTNLLEDFDIVDSPLPQYKNLPNGEYLIRGNKKSYSKEYWMLDNVWHLVADTKKDNGRYFAISSTYRLFPMLPTSEYKVLTMINAKLSKEWQRNVYGFNMWLHNRNHRREFEKTILHLT